MFHCSSLALPLLAFASMQPPVNAPLAQDQDFKLAVATEAYTYAFPMVLMEMTRRASTNIASPVGMFAPMNQWAHARAFPDHEFRAVVRPNVDTLYSIVWFDVSEEPLVLSIPEGTERYHMLPMLDMWTDVFACPGTRTTGSGGGNFAITGPDWSGELPAGVEGIRSPTSIGWVIGRTQTNGPSDYETVHAIQDSFGLAPLSQYGKDPAPIPAQPINASIDMSLAPLARVDAMSAEEFYEVFAQLLVDNPPHEMDWPILARMRRIGLVAGEPLNYSTLDADTRDALERGAQLSQAMIAQQAANVGLSANGWSIAIDGMGTYGASYLQRAYVARIGLGANLTEDAIYPMGLAEEGGEPYDGSRTYRLHFAAGELPPVHGFWSLTLYDDEMFLSENPIGRYAIGDRDELQFNEEGSLDLLIQHAAPAAELRSNWLPAPAGKFDLVLRMYWPDTRALTAQWLPPAVTRVETAR